MQRLGLRQRLFDRVKPRHHALDIAVHRHGSDVEGDRADRRRRVRPDPRQFAQAFLGIGKHPAMVAQHRHCAGMQIARARIIAEPGPHPQHVVLRGAAERGDIRPARQKLLEIRPDRFDAGLLQHDFGQPDPIRIGPLARRRPPRQPAAMAVVPVEQQRGAGGAAFGRFSSFAAASEGTPHLKIGFDMPEFTTITQRVIVAHDSSFADPEAERSGPASGADDYRPIFRMSRSENFVF